MLRYSNALHPSLLVHNKRAHLVWNRVNVWPFILTFENISSEHTNTSISVPHTNDYFSIAVQIAVVMVTAVTSLKMLSTSKRVSQPLIPNVLQLQSCLHTFSVKGVLMIMMIMTGLRWWFTWLMKKYNSKFSRRDCKRWENWVFYDL